MRRLLLLSCVCGLLFTMGCQKKRTEVPSWFRVSRTEETRRADNRPVAVPTRGPNFSTQIEKQRWDLNNHIVALDHKVKALDAVLADLDAERSETVRKLRDVGVVSAEDLKDNLLAQTYAKNLHSIRQEMKTTTSKRKIYKVTLEEGRAVLRRVDRQIRLARAGIADNEVQTLHTAILEINERLQSKPRTPDLGDQLQLEVVVDEELRNFD